MLFCGCDRSVVHDDTELHAKSASPYPFADSAGQASEELVRPFAVEGSVTFGSKKMRPLVPQLNIKSEVSSPKAEPPLATEETAGLVKVRTMAGSEHDIFMKFTSTVEDLISSVRPELGLQGGDVHIMLGEDLLKQTQMLGEVPGIGSAAVLTACAVPGFDICMTGYNGPNSPRFGATTVAHYKLICSCGHTETFDERAGYVCNVPSHPPESCPKCGAGPTAGLRSKMKSPKLA